MTAIEVLLIILGFIFVGLSFLISNKASEEEGEAQGNKSAELWSEKDEQMVRDRIEEVIADKVDFVTEHTTERLNRMSNEKIMAVDEFSSQLLEKIEQNHKEVVFMYNMLEEKEKELKKASLQAEAPVKKTSTQTVKDKKTVKKKPAKPATPKQQSETPDVMVEASDVNKKIRELYQSGKSILEISKELDMGQGEVKLVIDLYGGR